MFKLHNKKGDILMNNIVGIGLGLLLGAIMLGSMAMSAMQRANEYSNFAMMSDIGDSLTVLFYDHPGFPSDIGLAYDTTTGTYDEVDATASSKALDIINSYLDDAAKFDSNGRSIKTDPWKNNYEIYLAANDLDIDVSSMSVSRVDTSSMDTEFRIIIKSTGKNKTVRRADTPNLTASGAYLDDKDDVIFVIQCVNGDVKTASYGVSKNRGMGIFVDDSDTNRALDEFYAF